MARRRKVKGSDGVEASAAPEVDVSAAAEEKEPTVQKRPGRKPMSPAEKVKAAAARAEEKRKAANMKPEIRLQYQGDEVDMESLVNAAKEDFKQTKKRTLITSLVLYVKPDEHTAYYVVNNSYEGKITY